MNFNPDQPRDGNGRWVKSKSSTQNFFKNHGDEVVLGLALVGTAALAYGTFTAVGVNAAAAEAVEMGGAQAARAFTVRKVGPVATGKVASLFKNPAVKNTIPKTVEGFQYHAGAFDPNLGSELRPVGRLFKDLRVGAEVVTKSGTKAFGAAKPLGYNDIPFRTPSGVTRAGKYLIGGATAAQGITYLSKKDKRS